MRMYIQQGDVDVQTGEHKFILYQDHGTRKIMSRALPRHKNIYALVADSVDENAVQGGGWVAVDSDMHTIKFYGKSSRYGPFDKGLLNEVLVTSDLEKRWFVQVEAMPVLV